MARRWSSDVTREQRGQPVPCGPPPALLVVYYMLRCAHRHKDGLAGAAEAQTKRNQGRPLGAPSRPADRLTAARARVTPPSIVDWLNVAAAAREQAAFSTSQRTSCKGQGRLGIDQSRVQPNQAHWKNGSSPENCALIGNDIPKSV